jgi:shikimate 5-dehydrogenase
VKIVLNFFHFEMFINIFILQPSSLFFDVVMQCGTTTLVKKKKKKNCPASLMGGWPFQPNLQDVGK